MIPVTQIFSEVQTELNDLSALKIQHGEYIDFADQVARIIAQETGIFINRYVTTPNPLWTEWSENTAYYSGQIVLTNLKYYICITPHTSSNDFSNDTAYWSEIPAWAEGQAYSSSDMVYTAGPQFWRARRTHTSILANKPPSDDWDEWETVNTHVYNVTLPDVVNGSNFGPFELIRVSRGQYETTTLVHGIPKKVPSGWHDCQQETSQAVARNHSGASRKVNNSVLSRYSFSVQYAHPTGYVDGNLYLIFAEPFLPGEVVVIDYISNKPFDNNPLVKWDPDATNPTSIPDFLYEAFRAGMMFYAARRLAFQSKGDNRLLNLMQIAQQEWDGGPGYKLSGGKLGDAKWKAKGKFQDKNSKISPQPINWFGED